MARRKSENRGMLDGLCRLPWPVGVGVAAAFWVAGMVFPHVIPAGSMQKALAPLFVYLFWGLALLSMLAAAISAVRANSRRMMLDRQTGLDSLRALSWREFEQLVGEAYRRQGYDVTETGGGGADGGIDLILRGRRETVLVQCKQWKARQVGVDKIRELFGIVTAERADRGILVTSGTYTNEARSFQAGKPLTLVDGPALVQLVRDVQPSRPASATLPAAPTPAGTTTCPRCGSPMVLRTARRGANAGSSFYGCTRYPACKGIRPAD